MASHVHPPATATNPDTLITVKVSFDGNNRKFKLPLKGLTPAAFASKLRELLQVSPTSQLNLERFSDSSGAYLVLDQSNPSAYKQLYRAAKAKLKLRIRASIVSVPDEKAAEATSADKITNAEVAPTAPASTTYASPRQTMQTTLCERPAMASTANSSSAPPPYSKIVNVPGTASPLLLSPTSKEFESHSMKEPTIRLPVLWRVYCNNCDDTMESEHFHCSTCDAGDYDLCRKCVDSGVTCPGDGHWLIKRFFSEGKIINSTTERIAPKRRHDSTGGETKLTPQPCGKSMPGRFKADAKLESEMSTRTCNASEMPSRTCNSCVRVLPEAQLVTCADCPDYDVCISCNYGHKHGHNPGHTFKMIVPSASASKEFLAICAPGRNVSHAAICDGCNIDIRGVRHKCLDCPDWDYCNKCYQLACLFHPGHRFAPIYSRIGFNSQPVSQHWGIYCDGPLCKGKTHQSYIRGIRYKCTACHDTDFCANCEAHPTNKHNTTHPLIKFRTQVTNVNVTTIEEDTSGRTLLLGDHVVNPLQPSKAASASATAGDRGSNSTTVTPPLPSSVATETGANSASVSPAPSLPQPAPHATGWCGTDIGGLSASTLPVPASASTISPPSIERIVPEANGDKPVSVAPSILDAHFLHDRIIDGTQLPPSIAFMQSWTLRNPGPNPWPIGCSVRHVGGDNMLNLDHSYPSSTKDLALAQGSNATTSVIGVGSTFTFAVVMRTPAREGKYISYWRLKAPDGTPFGHKLWCDVEVSSSAGLPAFGTTISGAPVPVMSPAVPPSGALADYQMQLMLLEQQNKKRLMMVCDGTIGPLSAENTTNNSKKARCEQGARAYPPSLPAVYDKGLPSTTAGMAVPTKSCDVSSSSSTMVFPKLEKESPTSSTTLEADIKPIKTENESESEPVACEENDSPSKAVVEETDAVYEDAEFEDDDESLLNESERGDEDEESFMTDEEYDILDASDEDIVHPTSI